MATPLQKAMRLHEAGQLSRARSVFERILKKNPREVNALHYLGVVLHQQGQHDKGARLIEKAVEIHPAHPVAWQNLGGIYVSTRQFEKAVAAFRKVIGYQPANAQAYIYLCKTLCHLRRYQDAAEAGRTATLLSPGDKHCWHSLGDALKQGGHLEPAIECYEKAIALDAYFPEAHRELCHTIGEHERKILARGARPEKTIGALKNWLKADPDNPMATYILAAIEGGQEVKRSPDEYVSRLFDGFAEDFDRRLEELDYQAPNLVIDRVRVRLGTPDVSLDVLDAGCGTGLLAAGLKPYARQLTGVDLSSGMLEKARSRGLYDRLERAELTAFLQGHPACYDLLICCDTLIYFGELEEITAAMETALRSGGIAICTLENLRDDAGNYYLNPHGRFSHREDYLKRCLAAAGLSLVSCQEIVLRKESGKPVTGLLVEALKP